MANALVTGVVGRLRYVFLSDALLQYLTESEVEAVFAHEMAHVRHRHIPFYLVLCLTFMVFLAAIEGTFGLGFDYDDTSIPWLAAVAAAYWIGVIGVVSRRLESQADLCAVGLIGNVHTFVFALEKIAELNGLSRSTRSWRHFRMDRRIKFLLDAAENPEVAARFQRRVRLMQRGTVLALIVCGLWLARLYLWPLIQY